MTKLLQQAIAQIQQLPPDQQDAIAARFLAEDNIGRLREVYPLSKSAIGLCSICLRAAIMDRMSTKFWVKWQ
ncbi:hypothetical protein H4N54_18070 [Limnospira fusiformis KN01]|uniref:hypothetical protein n=1 Tax=Limnospira TaxID=2596745 RepID=UPI0001E2A3F4|nr:MULTISPECIES: hypothetical protein [Limnospira]EKD10901.1 hypothetical protein SPLC1_S051090 [Arthrospira platensis C1]QJB24426.1 hypothetical protein HFV01_21940 [Limnospira fusiformis SAG 85.79]MDT9188345.1 hypothetical protein [Limnospira sp. PMC 894.15]MDT9200701.1 hypothetical protein [Limnospira sp. PMC 1042.18]MDT9234103.1 hypothetical protein [Limnospira sp. PMC 917.15]